MTDTSTAAGTASSSEERVSKDAEKREARVQPPREVPPENQVSQHAHDADEAMKAFEGLDGQPIVLTEADNKRLLRRIDWHLMPLMCMVYSLNYLDKAVLTFAGVMGVQEDLNLKGDNFQWLGSIFHIGFLLWEYPSTLLLQRLPLAKYTGACILLWGLVTAALAGTKDFAGAAANRFLLGALESAVTPAFVLITSQWYTKYEQTTRTAIWFSFAGVGQIYGYFLAYGILIAERKNALAIEPWKALTLITGILTMAFGAWFWWVIPDSQLNARWLKKEDRTLAVERVRVNQQGIGNKHFKMYQFKEALTDLTTWAFALYVCVAFIANGGLSIFYSQILVSLGYTPEKSFLVGTPIGVILAVGTLVLGVLGDRFGERLLLSMIPQSIAIIGMTLIVALPPTYKVVRLVGFYTLGSTVGPLMIMIGMLGTNFAGTTKKTTVAALFIISMSVGSIIGPQVFRPQYAPEYVLPKICVIVCWSLCLVDVGFLRWYYRRRNQKKAEARAAPGYFKVPNQEFLDLTDKENPEFTYQV
ncbi:hypothetical protein AJ80_02270 [Polytolypa hystricis UAMH7299]|uniref:Major facilitator superfamily (MFS) profile domain-containing protein n=1 Tax=Polytolypa hystricis (strain UAMH7299) TaxID=1447883 RepID=A0A2B7YHU8_POLH7|nr:hypothetical protein AJ80_02270 [Polytolypa hystricis UAMH7299]